MKKLLYTISLLVAISLITACSSDDDDYINLSRTEVTADFDQTSFTVEVKASGEWTASSNAAWCKVEQPTGQGNAQVTVTLQHNMSTEPRPETATITFVRGSAEATVSVTQAGMPSDANILPYIEDAALKAFLSPSGTSFTLAQALKVNSLNLFKNKVFISSAKGLEFFTNLDTLVIRNSTDLTEIDATPFRKLRYLDLENNSLTRIDAGGLTELEILYCLDNKISELKLKDNAKLTFLSCMNNGMTRLELSGLNNLEYLDINTNNLTELDVSGSVKLKSIHCGKNKFVRIDISQNKDLLYFDANPNENLKQVKVHNGFVAPPGFFLPNNAHYVLEFY